jgi:hypothetical protein
MMEPRHVVMVHGNVEGVHVDLMVLCAIVLGVAKVWLLEVVVELVLVMRRLEVTKAQLDSSSSGGGGDGSLLFLLVG